MKDYSELVAYFEGFPTSLPAIRTVTVGADEEMLATQSHSIDYPHLRVDTPTLQFINEDESPATRYQFQFFLLTNVPDATDYRAENTALSDMEKILRGVLKKLWDDADSGFFDLVIGPAKGDAVRRWSGDNCFGWYLTVTIQLETSDC